MSSLKSSKKQWLNSRQITQRLGFNTSRPCQIVIDLIAQGLPVFQFNGRWYCDEADLEVWMDSIKTKAFKAC